MVKRKTKKEVKKEKNSETFMKEMMKAMTYHHDLLKPNISFDGEHDIFFLWFGGDRRIAHTTDVSPTMRFDVTNDGLICSVEVEGLFEYLKNLSKNGKKEKIKNKDKRGRPKKNGKSSK